MMGPISRQGFLHFNSNGRSPVYEKGNGPRKQGDTVSNRTHWWYHLCFHMQQRRKDQGSICVTANTSWIFLTPMGTKSFMSDGLQVMPTGSKIDRFVNLNLWQHNQWLTINSFYILLLFQWSLEIENSNFVTWNLKIILLWLLCVVNVFWVNSIFCWVLWSSGLKDGSSIFPPVDRIWPGTAAWHAEYKQKYT